MCKKKQFKYCPSEIDECMRNIIDFINNHTDIYETVACCCGHGKYSQTILIRILDTGEIYDLVSDKIIPRKKKFYKKDKQGYYYIPEVVENKTKSKAIKEIEGEEMSQDHAGSRSTLSQERWL